jgi:hypothetical protein
VKRARGRPDAVIVGRPTIELRPEDCEAVVDALAEMLLADLESDSDERRDDGDEKRTASA